MLRDMRILLVLASVLLVAVAGCVGDPPAVDRSQTGRDAAVGSDGAPQGPDGALTTTDADTPLDGARGEDTGADAPAPTCGAPGLPCCAGAACQGGATCTAGTCACAATKTACAGACVDTLIDTANCGRCGRDCLGGACTGGQCAAYTVATGQSSVRKIVVSSGRAFWTRAGNAVTTGGLFSAKLDGTGFTPHYETGLGAPCSGLTIAQGTARFVCKATATTREIRSCAVPACSSSQVVAPSVSPQAGPMASDGASGRTFFAVGTLYNNAPDGTILDAMGTQVGSPGQANPADIVFDNGYVYWLNAGTYATDTAQKNGGVYRASLAALGAQQTVVGTNAIYFDNSSLSVDAFNAYYVGHNAITGKYDVLVAPASGGSGLTVFAADLAVHQVVSDGTNVFFDDATSQTLRYCPRAAGCGGGTRPLATAEPNVYAIAADAVSIFWENGQGLIRRIAKP